jgi:hypothetical protein
MHSDQPGHLGGVERGIDVENASSTWMAEIATIDASSFCLSPAKSILVIQTGQFG